MPVQKEITSCLESPVFNAIINGYSYGDKVQKLDSFSSAYSDRLMNNIMDLHAFKETHPHLIRCDMQLIARHEVHRIDHTNMWFMAKSARIFRWLDPLPFVVLCPLIIAALPYCNAPDMLACFHGDNHHCSATLKRYCNHDCCVPLYETVDVYDPLKEVVDATYATWYCQDFSRHCFINRRELHSLLYALGGSGKGYKKFSKCGRKNKHHRC